MQESIQLKVDVSTWSYERFNYETSYFVINCPETISDIMQMSVSNILGTEWSIGLPSMSQML